MWFVGHLNDAQLLAIMRSVGNDLPLVDEYVLLRLQYISRHPIVTPYSKADLRQRYNRRKYIQQYRVVTFVLVLCAERMQSV